MRAPLALGAVLTLALPLLGGVYGELGQVRAQGALRPEVVSLEFQGNASFSDAEIGVATGTKRIAVTPFAAVED